MNSENATPKTPVHPDCSTVPDLSGVRGTECNVCHTWATAWRKYRGRCKCGSTVAARDGSIQMTDGTSFHGLSIE